MLHDSNLSFVSSRRKFLLVRNQCLNLCIPRNGQVSSPTSSYKIIYGYLTIILIASPDRPNQTESFLNECIQPIAPLLPILPPLGEKTSGSIYAEVPRVPSPGTCSHNLFKFGALSFQLLFYLMNLVFPNDACPNNISSCDRLRANPLEERSTEPKCFRLPTPSLVTSGLGYFQVTWTPAEQAADIELNLHSASSFPEAWSPPSFAPLQTNLLQVRMVSSDEGFSFMSSG
jgi:hypothetical protein